MWDEHLSEMSNKYGNREAFWQQIKENANIDKATQRSMMPWQAYYYFLSEEAPADVGLAGMINNVFGTTIGNNHATLAANLTTQQAQQQFMPGRPQYVAPPAPDVMTEDESKYDSDYEEGAFTTSDLLCFAHDSRVGIGLKFDSSVSKRRLDDLDDDTKGADAIMQLIKKYVKEKCSFLSDYVSDGNLTYQSVHQAINKLQDQEKHLADREQRAPNTGVWEGPAKKVKHMLRMITTLYKPEKLRDHYDDALRKRPRVNQNAEDTF